MQTPLSIIIFIPSRLTKYQVYLELSIFFFLILLVFLQTL